MDAQPNEVLYTCANSVWVLHIFDAAIALPHLGSYKNGSYYWPDRVSLHICFNNLMSDICSNA